MRLNSKLKPQLFIVEIPFCSDFYDLFPDDYENVDFPTVDINSVSRCCRPARFNNVQAEI